jgi:hypothetical protein
VSDNPQVLHIGFSKCASTYLRALLRASPAVHMVFKSGFFTPFLARDMTFRDYQGLFRDETGIVNVESDEHLTLPGVHPTLGIRTTNLDEFVEVADKIRAYVPHIRIIMVIRNQTSLIVSRYSEFLITGGSLCFEDFVADLLGEDGNQNLWYQNYYRRIIGILEDRFPRQNLLILLQEAMRENAQQTAATISRFIGLTEDLKLIVGLRSERRSLSLAGLRLLARLNRLMVKRPGFGGAPPTTRVPLIVFRNAVRIVRAVDYYVLGRLSASASALMTSNVAQRIMDEFRADNIELQKYFGRDLGAFGYLD